MKNILMIAFHYPPVQSSSGLQRSLKFSRYLLDHGWCAQVLSAHPRAYRQCSDDQMSEIPEEVVVKRAWAMDTARHLSIAGRYPSLLALPDRWVSWVLGAIPSGLMMIRRHRPKLLWSTFPIASAHVIGHALHRLTGIPWIADFRDSMTEEHYPHDETVRKRFRRIERRAVKSASRIVFTTDGTRDMYAQRYPDVPPSHWQCIANGYDEENFLAADQRVPAQDHKRGGRIKLLHSGIMYRLDRDPTAFFVALGRLRARGEITPERLEIVLRASGHEKEYGDMIRAHGIGDIVTLQPRIDYLDALAEMLDADGLLVFQGSGCNHQIPAKIYECMRAGKPILALTDPAGDTATVLSGAGVDSIALMTDPDAVESAIRDFLGRIERGESVVPNPEYSRQFSRRSQTAKLAQLLDEVDAANGR